MKPETGNGRAERRDARAKCGVFVHSAFQIPNSKFQMRIATIRGYATSTVKHASLEGWRLSSLPSRTPRISRADRD